MTAKLVCINYQLSKFILILSNLKPNFIVFFEMRLQAGTVSSD